MDHLSKMIPLLTNVLILIKQSEMFSEVLLHDVVCKMNEFCCQINTTKLISTRISNFVVIDHNKAKT